VSALRERESDGEAEGEKKFVILPRGGGVLVVVLLKNGDCRWCTEARLSLTGIWAVGVRGGGVVWLA
jgi:hypothetical protein